MGRVWALCVVVMIAAGCAPQQAVPATAPPAPLLPVDATASPEPTLTLEATPDATVEVTPSEPLPTLEASTDFTPPATDAAGGTLAPLTPFDATPTPEAIAAQVVPPAGFAAEISADAWRSVVPHEAGELFSGVDLVGGTLTVPYPAGWQASGDANGLMLANFAGALAADVDFVDQQAAMSITLIPNDLAPMADAEGFEPSAPLILAHFIHSAAVTVDGATWGQVLLTQANRRPAAIVSGTNGADDALVVCVQLEDGYALITAVAEVGGLPAVLPSVALVARAIAYTR